jgi:hypothetical protein
MIDLPSTEHHISGMLDSIAKARFDEKVMPEPMSGCWLWIGAVQSSGYGNFGTDGKNYLAHRVSYTERRGPIPEGMTIDHKCRTRSCVNPDHMEVVPFKENLRRRNAAKTHCKNGHPLAGDNAYIRPDGLGRGCRECRRQANERRS